MRCALALAILVAGSAQAQQDQISVENRLQALRQKLESRRADEGRLLDLRIRHDLGLPVQGDHYFMPVAAEDLPTDQLQRQLQTEELEVADLTERLQDLRAQLEKRREGLSSTPAPQANQRWVPIPRPGSLPDQAPIDPQGQRPMPLAEVGIRPTETGPPQTEVKAVIRGSVNHRAVAGSLHRLAASLLGSARKFREEGRIEEARAQDERARVKLEYALKELEPLVSVDNPDFADLFLQGKCLEELFNLDTRYGGLKGPQRSKEFSERYEEMREPFLQIMAKDREGSASSEQLGSWGQSAQTALRLIRWMSDFGDYKPTIEIDSIQWIRK